jgi:predicted permease
MLCRKNGGAEVWHALFVGGGEALGRRFTESEFAGFLANRFGSSRDPIGPLLRTYSDPAALGKVAAISQENGFMELRKVPAQPAMYDTVAALFFIAWDAEFPSNAQVALRELEGASSLMATTGWSLHEQSQFLSELERRDWAKVDRQTGDPIVTRLISTIEILKVMYDRLP